MPWTHLEYGGPEVRLGRFNFHREEDYLRAEAFLRGEGPSVLVLSADVRGAGRGYFLDALAFRLRYEALPPLIWHLDLSGFEPDNPQAILAYLGYQLEKRQARFAGQKDELLKIARPLSQWIMPTELGATLVALLLELRDPVQAFEKLLAAEADGLRGPLTRHMVLRVEIDPLSQPELRRLIDMRLDPNDLPDEIVEAVWRATGGIPARVGARMAEMVADGAITDGGGGWSLHEKGITAEEVAERFRGEIDDKLNAWFLEQGDNGELLRNLLVLGALCGDVFLPKLFLGRHRGRGTGRYPHRCNRRFFGGRARLD